MPRFKVVHTDGNRIAPNEIELGELAKIDADIVVVSGKDRDEVISVCRAADAILNAAFKMTRDVMGTLEKCRIIVRYGIGVDNVDLDAATDYGIMVANVPDFCVDEVSNHAIGLLLASVKKICLLDREMRKGRWPKDLQSPMEKIYGQTLGLAGFGKIARLVAKKARVFGLDVIVYDPYITDQAAEEAGVRKVSLETLLRASDFISVHVPLTPETYHMFDEEHFRAMKKTAFFQNLARGSVVNEKALVKALKEKWIAGAALDVFEKEPVEKDNPLLGLDNVVLTPHSASYSDEAFRRLRLRVAEEAVRVLSGQMPKNLVNKDVVSKKEFRGPAVRL